jgi:PAS domain S-box-containing protein
MKFYLEKRVLLGFLIALAIIVWLGVNSFLNNQKFAETSKMVAHTNEVLFHAEQVLALLMEMESNQRAFVIVDDEIFLQPITQTLDTLASHITNLKRLTRDNSNQQKRLMELESLISDKIEFVKKVVNTRRTGFEPAVQLVQSMKGKMLMEKIRTVINGIENEEHVLLQRRVILTEKNATMFNYTFSALLGATAVILILVFIAIHHSLEARTKVEMALRAASDEIKDLYENAPCGYYSLNDNGMFVNANQTFLSLLGYERKGDIIGKLKFIDIVSEATREVFDANFAKFKEAGVVNNLEFEFVRKDGSMFPVILNSTAIFDKQGHFFKSRSTVFDITEKKKAENKIKQLNNELEAFTYSVSHDLRSPLRSIDGYTKILAEDYASKIDDEGRRLMNVIMNNARRMGQLIDDLLNFSRIGRKEIAKSNFNTEKMITGIVAEQKEHEADRDIEFSIQQLPQTFGDFTMMRQVWENLISNAMKYTRKARHARVEIGSFIDNNEIAFYIKDNGVGFDMNYSHKLFGVFQRLHKIQDFEGTGVGLAIVYRIVTRHGGRVWAESILNEGATFTFTLPISSN